MDSLLFFHLTNGLLMMLIPVILALVLLRRWRLGWRLLLVGGATFVLSQVGHIPFNSLMTLLFNKTGLANLSAENALLFNAVFLGLSAGFFEELFRNGMFRWWLKDARSWRKGVMAGVGHGGTEALILGGLVLFTLIQMIAVRDMDLSTVYSGSTLQLAQQQVTTYWSMPWYDALMGAVERLFTIPIQVSLAVIVIQGFIRHQKRWLWLAIGYHALVDAVSVYAVSKIGVYWVEGMVAVFALVSLGIIFHLRSPEPTPAVAPVVTAAAPQGMLQSSEPSSEQLDNSKYS